MDDVAERLRQIEQNPSPDLWGEIEERARQPKISRPPRRSRLAAGLVAAAVGVAAVFIAVRAFNPTTEPVSVPAAPILNPAPRDCPVGLVNMSTTDVASFQAAVHGQLPTWMPAGFGLLRTYGGGRLTYGIWSDQNCREVELNYSTFDGSPTGPTIPRGAPVVGPWRVTGDVPDGCSNQVLGKARCLDYMTSTAEGTIVLQMMGLDREEGDRIALSIDLGGPPSTPSLTVSNGKIAFARYSDVGRQINTINSDGTSAATLTDVSGSAFHPAWSPDGRRLLFDVQATGGRMQIFVVNNDGTGLTQLTDDPGWNYLPAWSSDGSKIAFVSSRDGNDEIYVMNSDGTAQTRLTASPDEDLNPSWAPDGDMIAFQSNRAGGNDIYVMNADGSSVTRLTDDTAAFDGQPEWSPDGERIAFASDRDGAGLYTMATDGTDVVQLTHDPDVGSLDPAWSPDGASIVYTTSVNGSNKLGIFLIDVETRSREAVPGANGDLCCPSWQPILGDPID